MPVDLITLELFDQDGTTSLGALTHVHDMTWQHELSKPGSGQFKIAATDPLFGQITPRRIVKFTWRGAVRFGIRIQADSVQAAVEHPDGRVADVRGPGLMDLLHDGVVLPEYGIKRASGDDRRFGFMSLDGPWRVPAEWQVPTATVWTSYSRAPEYPEGWPDPAASWLGRAGTDPGYKTWYRGLFATGTSEPGVRVYFSCDDEVEVYLDGERLFGVSADATVSNNTYTFDLPLPAGTHQFAAVMTDVFQWAGESLKGEMMFAVATLDAEGQPDTILAHSSATDWTVRVGTSTNGEPGWRRAQVIKKCFDEAAARGAAGIQALSLTFDDDLDSDGEAWAALDRGDYNFPNAMIGLDEVVQRLTEDFIDADVDAATMTLNVYNRKGVDLSGTVALGLSNADPETGNLVEYTTTRTAQVINNLYGRLEDGTWVLRTEATSQTTWGRVEAGASIGSTTSDQTAAQILDGILAQTADTVEELVAQPDALVGAVAYVDYTLGDSIVVPGHRGQGTVKARVLAITVKQDGESVVAWPELVMDTT